MHLSIVHHGCHCQAPHTYESNWAFDIAVYLWGRDLRTHTVYWGECPYHFVHADVELIEGVLECFPFPVVRPFLPLTVFLGDLPATYAARRGLPRDTLVCVIGGPPPATPSADESRS